MENGPIETGVCILGSWHTTFGASCVAALLTILGSIVFEYLRMRIFRPILKIKRYSSESEHIQPAKVPGKNPGYHDSYYVKVAVNNVSRTVAKDCRAYLSTLCLVDANGEVLETLLSESLRLCWAFEGTSKEGNKMLHKGIDIPNGATVCFDVYSSKFENANPPHESRIVEFASESIRYSPMFANKIELGKKYRFDLVVTCDGGDPVWFSILLDIGKKWDSLKVISIRG